tara:strand:+ start:77823 stop:78347 length:525 start_codon:yes stop_codon:yes gene_type:complete
VSTVITQERRGSEDRRIMIATPLFPFFDSEDTLVRQDRRLIPDRRINNITIEEPVLDKPGSRTEEALGNKRLFIWFQDEIHEIKRGNKDVWVGRSPDCLATFSSRFVSRKHARLYYEEGAYYLVDDSVNGTYIKNDDGETFITKGKVIVKGSGVISLGVPLDHSESDLIHFFIG